MTKCPLIGARFVFSGNTSRPSANVRSYGTDGNRTYYIRPYRFILSSLGSLARSTLPRTDFVFRPSSVMETSLSPESLASSVSAHPSATARTDLENLKNHAQSASRRSQARISSKAAPPGDQKHTGEMKHPARVLICNMSTFPDDIMGDQRGSTEQAISSITQRHSTYEEAHR